LHLRGFQHTTELREGNSRNVLNNRRGRISVSTAEEAERGQSICRNEGGGGQFSIPVSCVVRVPGYTTEMYCVSCEVRTEFIYVM
jgi:hypothetical protein